VVRRLGAGLGIEPQELYAHRAIPEVAALADWLWSVSYRGRLAEAVAAVNYAIEGPLASGRNGCCRRSRPKRPGGQATTWLRAHARYDDAHPHEALEIVKPQRRHRKGAGRGRNRRSCAHSNSFRVRWRPRSGGRAGGASGVDIVTAAALSAPAPQYGKRQGKRPFGLQAIRRRDLRRCGAARWVEAVTEPDRAILRGLLLPGSWYPVGTWNRLVDRYVATLGRGDPQSFRAVAEYIAPTI